MSKTGRRRERLAPGKRPGGPWYGNCRHLIQFEYGLQQHYPRVRREIVRSGKDRGLWYRLTVPVPGYASRQVEIRFPRRHRPSSVRVHADGPDDSPHRYGDCSLCMWYPKDPEYRRWMPEHGLVRLIDLSQLHLFYEAWWRETGEWLGEEAPHGPVKRDLPRRLRRA